MPIVRGKVTKENLTHMPKFDTQQWPAVLTHFSLATLSKLHMQAAENYD